MVAYAFGDFTVTSWGPTTEEGHVWRARSSTNMKEFFADRHASVEELAEKGARALSLDLRAVAEDLLSTVAALRNALDRATMVDEDERLIHLCASEAVFNRSFKALRGEEPT